MTSLKVNLTNPSNGKTSSVASIPSLKLALDIARSAQTEEESDASKTLIHNLQRGMQTLKENTFHFKTLKSSSRRSMQFDEPAQVHIKTLDFRKIKKNSDVQNSSARMMNQLQDRIHLLDAEKPLQIRPHRYAEVDTSLSDLSLRHLGRGLDPTPDILDSFMHQTPKNPADNTPVTFPATTYHIQYADYLAKKLIDDQDQLNPIEIPKEEPREIQRLRIVFQDLNKFRRGVVDKTALIGVISKDLELSEMFGGIENLEVCMENAECDAITVEEFLTIYQVSKNNLLRNIVSQDNLESIMKEKEAKKREIAQIISKKPMSITVPKPFSFTTREGRKEESIRQRKLREMLEEKEQQTEESIKIKFEAKPVPPEVIIPLYDQIMQEQETRRRQVKEQSIAMTKASEKPFSFYYRDQEKSKLPAENHEPGYSFKANPVPRDSQILKMHEFQQLEENRKERIGRKARELYMKSSLPPRMAMHQQRTSVTPHPRVEMTFKFTSKPVPDFESLQNRFQRTLDTVKQNQVKTVPQPFNFQESRRLCKYAQLLDETPTAQEKWAQVKTRSKSFNTLSKPKYIIKPTEKLKEIYKLKEKQIELQKLKKHQIKESIRAREEKRNIVRQQVHSCALIKDTGNYLKRQAEYNMLKRIAESKKHERAYEFFKAQMMESIRRRPLLVEMVGREQSEEEFSLEQIQENFDEDEYTQEFGEQSGRYSF